MRLEKEGVIMTIKDAITFEMEYNFVHVSYEMKQRVLLVASVEFDLEEDAHGSYIDFHSWVDETMSDIIDKRIEFKVEPLRLVN